MRSGGGRSVEGFFVRLVIDADAPLDDPVSTSRQKAALTPKRIEGRGAPSGPGFARGARGAGRSRAHVTDREYTGQAGFERPEDVGAGAHKPLIVEPHTRAGQDNQAVFGSATINKSAIINIADPLAAVIACPSVPPRGTARARSSAGLVPVPGMRSGSSKERILPSIGARQVQLVPASNWR
jgi:hypothetical protein